MAISGLFNAQFGLRLIALRSNTQKRGIEDEG